MGLFCVICILCAIGGIGYGIYCKQRQARLDTPIIEQNKELQALNQKYHKENNDIIVELKNNSEKINELTQQYNNLNMQVTFKKAEMHDLVQNIDSLSSNIKAAARASFEQYCDSLDNEYYQMEGEYDELIGLLKSSYEQQHDMLQKHFAKEQQECVDDIEAIQYELAKIRATREAAMRAMLREEEIKNQATFYTLQINEADKRDIAYLQSIEYNLREARPLRMLIWSTFYRDKVNELAARVGAAGASGIYKITHIDSGISYIGQATNIKDRWITHVKCSLGIDTPVTSALYQFTREKGIDNFTFEILEKCPAVELNEKEKFYIDLYQTYDFGLNKTRGNK